MKADGYLCNRTDGVVRFSSHRIWGFENGVVLEVTQTLAALTGKSAEFENGVVLEVTQTHAIDTIAGFWFENGVVLEVTQT